MLAKHQMLQDLTTMLRDVLAAQARGGMVARTARAQGHVDGYMRALLDSGLVGRDELLALVARERTQAFGPGSASVAAPLADEVAA